jgi:hypothetical protein
VAVATSGAPGGPGQSPSAPATTRTTKADFEELTARVRSNWFTEEHALKVRSNGLAEYSALPRGAKEPAYTAAFRLGGDYLALLEEQLKQTDWLAKPSKVQADDAAEYTLTLTRQGHQRGAQAVLAGEDVYRGLLTLLERLRRQEELLYRLTAGTAREREAAAGGITEQIDGLHRTGVPRAPPALAIVDFGRFVPVFAAMLTDPSVRGEGEVVAALKTWGLLRDGSLPQALVALRAHESPKVREAAAEALLRIGGPRLGEVLDGLTADNLSEYVLDALAAAGPDALPTMRRLLRQTHAVAWPLIRMGPSAVDTIAAVFQVDPYPNQVHLIRAYSDHWKELGEADGRVAAAVRENMQERLLRGEDCQYHLPFLWLAAKAQVRGPRLEFRVLRAGGGANQEQFIRHLQANGPEPDFRYWTSMQWFQAQCELPASAVLAEYKGIKYALAGLSHREAMFADAAGIGAWGFKQVQPDSDERGQPAVAFQLDDTGSKTFARFIKESAGRPAAVVLDDRIVGMLSPDARVPGRGKIVGRFDPQQAALLAKSLAAGMPAVAPTSRPARYAFAPEVERIARRAGEQTFLFLDFESGNLLAAPFELEAADKARPLRITNLQLTDRLKKWIDQNGIDLGVEIRRDELGLMGLGTTSAGGEGASVNPQTYQRLAADEVVPPFVRCLLPNYPVRRGPNFAGTFTNPTPAYGFTFMTCDRHVGMVLLTDFGGEGQSVRIRYKMMAKAGEGSSPAAAVPAPRPQTEPAGAAGEALDDVDLEGLWNSLGEANAEKASGALKRLIAGGDRTVSFLSLRLHALTARAEPAKVQALVARLDSDRSVERAESRRVLAEIGLLAEPVLRRALESAPSPEARPQMESILEGYTYAASAETRRLVRSAWVLELIPGDQAQRTWERLSRALSAGPVPQGKTPLRTLQGQQLQADWAARDRADRLRAQYEAKHRDRQWLPKGPAEVEDFAEAMFAYREVLVLYSQTEVAGYCHQRLAGLYQFRGDRQRARKQLEEMAALFRGTKFEADAWFSLGLAYQHDPDKADQMLALMEKVPFPGGADDKGAVPDKAYDDAHVKYLSAQQQAAKCEIVLKRLDQAHRRYLALAQRYPQYKDNIAGDYQFQLRAAQLPPAEAAGRLLRFQQDLQAQPTTATSQTRPAAP